MLKLLRRIFGAAETTPQQDARPPLGDPRGLFAQDVAATKEFWRDMHTPRRGIRGNARELGADPNSGRPKASRLVLNFAPAQMRGGSSWSLFRPFVWCLVFVQTKRAFTAEDSVGKPT